MTDEQGKPLRLSIPEANAQAAGFRLERLAEVSGEHRTMSNVQAHFTDRRDTLYSRYRLARTEGEKRNVIKDMQRFNMDIWKHRGVIRPITTTSLKQATLQRPEKPFILFVRILEASL